MENLGMLNAFIFSIGIILPGMGTLLLASSVSMFRYAFDTTNINLKGFFMGLILIIVGALCAIHIIKAVERKSFNEGMQAGYGRVAAIEEIIDAKAYQSILDAMCPVGDYFVVALRAPDRTIEGLKKKSIMFGKKKWSRLDFEIVDSWDIAEKIEEGG
ncbi:MAG: hypothetical protein PHN74_02160 [Candidatus Pacebacteria bacterium]|nr:hypothetical protein [Candidatus Paceibacterota bacterium]